MNPDSTHLRNMFRSTSATTSYNSTMFIIFNEFLNFLVISVGVILYMARPLSFSRMPAFGTTSIGSSSCSFNHLTLGVVSAGPVEQFNPENIDAHLAHGCICRFIFVPRSIFPYCSNVTLAIIGTFLPTYLMAS